ncbi:MAG: nucleotide sugar dehydrogenase [Planctomycetota bacterium]|jgi:UDP-N-acetyl-D-glucosamine dehydrogenase|nr:nucleotide sugar dehydrogenase [Planctomycetota bacterium]
MAKKRLSVGVLGLGYVGLPLAIAFARAGARVVGFDLDLRKVKAVNAGRSYIRHIPAAEVRSITAAGGFASADPSALAEPDAVLICVPTPLTPNRVPDLRHVEEAADLTAETLRPGQLICLESTTYPGTTREVLLPRLERGGLKAGRDFFLAYSPEREDPGNSERSASRIPKVVGGLTPRCLAVAEKVYSLAVPATVPVSSLETAEAAKLMENIFRCVNIALVNELKQVLARLGIDIWEVVKAASTKPFGYMPFYPGPGLGGHCIPIDPFYLAWKARGHDCATRFIELAGEVNLAMPEYVAARAAEELNRERKSLNGSSLLLIGLAYKKNVDDVRESPSLRLLEIFSERGARVSYHDPLVPRMPPGHFTGALSRLASRSLRPETLRKQDAVIVATDHDAVDFAWVGRHARLVVDTRNAMSGLGKTRARVVKA